MPQTLFRGRLTTAAICGRFVRGHTLRAGIFVAAVRKRLHEHSNSGQIIKKTQPVEQFEAL